MKNKLFLIISIFVLFLILPVGVFAHPGKTDADGCHVCRKNCASWGLSDGEYHCHNQPTTIQTKEVKTEVNVSAKTTARQGASIKNIDFIKDDTGDSEENFIVTRVIDGDTIELSDGEKVRYIGIDTPETVDPRKSVQCFGKEASQANKDLVLNKTVILKKDISNTDKYGRLLRYVYLEDGTFVNLWLVKNGFATAYTYPPDVSYSKDFVSAEKQAMENKIGLWKTCR